MSKTRNPAQEVTDAFRLMKRVASGELSFLGLLAGDGGEEPQATVVAGEGEARCEKDSACLGSYNHDGGCIYDAPAEPQPDEEIAS